MHCNLITGFCLYSNTDGVLRNPVENTAPIETEKLHLAPVESEWLTLSERGEKREREREEGGFYLMWRKRARSQELSAAVITLNWAQPWKQKNTSLFLTYSSPLSVSLHQSAQRRQRDSCESPPSANFHKEFRMRQNYKSYLSCSIFFCLSFIYS